jgi:hypothetical protein
VTVAISTVICWLAAYRSFIIRRALASPAYRSRALWLGIIAFILIAYEILQILQEIYTVWMGPITPSLLIQVVYLVLTVPTLIIIFTWIDSTIRVALDMDFFHRDAFHWKRLRRLAWATVILGGFGGAASTNEAGFLIFGIIIGIPTIYSAAVLSAAGARVYDESMRKYLRWTRLLVVALALETVTASVNFYLNFPLVAFSYCLYRAAGSLSQISQIEASVD